MLKYQFVLFFRNFCDDSITSEDSRPCIQNNAVNTVLVCLLERNILVQVYFRILFLNYCYIYIYIYINKKLYYL